MIRKLLKFIGILLALLVVAIIVVLLVVDFDAVLNDQLKAEKPRIESALGRKIELGPVKATLFPLGAEVTEIRVLGRTPEEAPLMTLKRAHFKVDLWRALISAGTDTRLDELVIDGLVLNLVREKDGTLSYEDVVKRLAEGAPPEEAPKPLDAEQKRRLQNLVLDRVALVNAEIHLEDRTPATPAKTFIKQLSVELLDVALVSPFEVQLKAAVIAENPNLDVRMRLGPLPIGEPGAQAPLHWLTVKATDIDLGALVPYLGGALPVAIGSARFSADLRLDDPQARTGAMKLSGTMSVADLAVGEPLGQPFALALAPNVSFSPGAGVFDLTGFSLALDDMKLTADGKLAGIGIKPHFDGLKIRSENMDFDRIFALLPQALKSLPPGAKLGGPFSIQLTASGTPEAQAIEGALDFDGATIQVPGALSKPKGARLHLKTKADLAPDSLVLHRFALGLGPLSLDLVGSIKNFKQPIVNLKGDTGRFEIGSLLRFIPSVRAAVPDDVQLGGQAQVSVQIAGTAQQVKGDVKLGIYGADLAVPGATLQGTGEVVATVQGAPAGALALTLDTDLAGMAIEAGEAFKKPAGTPFAIHAAADRAPGSTTIKTFSLDLGPLHVTGSATLGAAMAVEATIQKFSVEQLAALLPALKGSPYSKATLGLKLAGRGDPKVPASVEAKIENLEFALGKNQLAGRAEVQNLDAPRVRFDFTSPWLDLDALLPAGGEEEKPAAGPPQIPDIVKRIDGEGSLQVAQGIFGGIPFTDFVGQLSLKNGKLRFSKLDFKAYEGTFTGADTHADLGAAKPAFGVKMSLKNVNAAGLLAEQAGLKKKNITGRLSTELDITGQGLVWEQIAPSLAGQFGLSLLNGKIENLDTETAILAPVALLLPLIQKDKIVKGQAFKSLAGTFEIKQGMLRLKSPMAIVDDKATFKLDGGIGLDQRLALTGTVELTPALIALASGGRIVTKRPLPVALKLGGTLSDPEITGIEVRALATELAKAAGLKGLDEARKVVEEKVEEVKAVVEEKVDDAKKQAEAAAEAAKAEAKKRADEAKKKAEEEAKKKAKGALKGLF